MIRNNKYKPKKKRFFTKNKNNEYSKFIRNKNKNKSDDYFQFIDLNNNNKSSKYLFKYLLTYIILFIIIFFFIKFVYPKIYENSDNNIEKVNNITLEELIDKLNKNEYNRKPKYILLFDFFINKYCASIDAYYIFQYYQRNNISYAYYIINDKSDLYNLLLMQNKTTNLIPVNNNDTQDILYPYLLNSKIIVQSYNFWEFNQILNKVNYLKFLKINHGIRYFKRLRYSDLGGLLRKKRNSIFSSPYEYELYKNKYIFKEENMFKGGLPRYDRFQNIIKNETEKECILISFTYRQYNNDIYDNSLLKKNILQLLNDESLISFLKEENIDLIYIQHHCDLYRNRVFSQDNFIYAQYKNPTFLEHYIEHCSLLVTDFSSISFDFIFQNKPALFYLIDYYERFNFNEKLYMKNFPQDPFVINNTFYDQNTLIEKVKYYVKRKFKIEDYLKKEYENVFYYKKNITERIVDIIDDIIHKKSFLFFG